VDIHIPLATILRTITACSLAVATADETLVSRCTLNKWIDCLTSMMILTRSHVAGLAYLPSAHVPSERHFVASRRAKVGDPSASDIIILSAASAVSITSGGVN
jgi:hypothetical protein